MGPAAGGNQPVNALTPPPGRAGRYAWVLAGRYDPKPDAEAGPRAEFEVFLARNGGVLLSRSSLDRPGGGIASALARAGRPSLALASLVQAQAASFDAIIASGEDIGVPIALASLAWRSRVPVHMMFHGHHLASAKLRLLAPVLRRLGHVHLHCLSQALAERTRAALGIPAARCHATGYGVDTAYFAPGPPGEPVLVASAGAANRDYATLIEAVRGLPVEVRIAADSTWMPPPPPGAEPGAKNVTLGSYGTYARLRALYGAASFVVVPLHPAGHACGYAVIGEALAMGRAVIATRTAVPPDFLRVGEGGVFVAAHDVAGLRACIAGLLANPAEAAAMGRRARALMQAEHSLERYCARLERIVRASHAAAAGLTGEKNYAAD
jgi:hypothetical protein